MAGLMGLAEMFAELDSVEERMKGEAATDTVKTLAEQTVSRMQELVPVDTGALRDSIHAEPAEEGDVVAYEITADSDHAIYPEFGTSNMAAEPYWRPSLHETEADFAKVAKQTYRKHIPELH